MRDGTRSEAGLTPRLTGGDVLLLIVLLGFRFYVEVNSRLLLIPAAGHDDGYFMRMASHIAAGQWLGPFDQFTLMKGPGYPIFVALSVFLGNPISFGHALFHLGAALVGAGAVLRLTRSKIAFYGALLLVLLVPAGFEMGVHRILRDQIYWGQTLMIFACGTLLMFAPPEGWKARLLLGLGGGATLAWALMTREEGIWFLPGLCVLLLAGLVFNGVSWKSAARLAPGLAGAAVGCAGLLLTLFTLNFMTYGAFIGVDFQDRAFKDAVGALSSIEDGGQIPQVPVSTVAMEKAAAVSPSFARLTADLRPDGPLAHWYLAGCTALPHTCGQIAGGWFVWALRDAAANAGDYASPMRARAAFSQMAADIRAACAAGTLTCRPTLYAHLPHLSGAQWLQVPGRFWEALTTAALVTRGSYDLATTRDEPNESLFNVYWSFLNYPRTYGPTSDRRETLGWVRRAPGEAWPSLAIRDDQGTQVRAHIQRMPSPDLVQMRDDEGAANDRFRADYACPGTCVLDAIFSDGTQLSLPLKVGGAVARSAGDRTLHVDATVAALNPAGLWNRSANAAGHIIRALLRAAPFVFPPLVALALLAFAWAGARCLTDRRLDAAWLSAATAWTLVGTRLALVALVDVSSFPAINAQYTLPATYLMALAIPLSLASGAAAWARQSSLRPKLAGSDGPPSSL